MLAFFVGADGIVVENLSQKFCIDVDGALDKFGQIEPKVLFAWNGHCYNNKRIDACDKIKHVEQR